MNCYRQMLQGLFTHRIAPDLVNDTLRQHCLFAGGLRNCLILHTFNEVPRTADKSTLLKRTLPTRNRFMHYALPALLTPFAHIRNVDERTVSHGLHGFTLASGTAMHTGGDLQRTGRKMVLGKQHFASVISQ